MIFKTTKTLKVKTKLKGIRTIATINNNSDKSFDSSSHNQLKRDGIKSSDFKFWKTESISGKLSVFSWNRWVTDGLEAI